MYKLCLPLTASLASALLLGLPVLALDPALVGVWTGVLKTPKGPVTAVWTINPHGGYTARFSGAMEIPDDEGELSADGGRWRRKGLQNTESGTYSIAGPGKFITFGSKGMTEWKKGGAAAVPISSAKPQPSNSALTAGNQNSAYSSFAKYNSAQAANSGHGPVASASEMPAAAPAMQTQKGLNKAQIVDKARQFLNSNTGQNLANYLPARARNMLPTAPQVVPGAYDPRWNPANFASQTTPQNNGYYQAPVSQAYNPWTQKTNANPSYDGSGPPISGDLQGLLTKDFPLPASGDEVQQFGLPALGRAAAGGMRKRDFRMIQ